MKIVIVGANSYIARNLYYRLDKKNNDILLYDYAVSQVDGAENYTQIDVLSAESVKKIDMRCDVLYMFVGKTGSADGFKEYDMFIDVNERSLLNVLNEYVNQKSNAKIVFPSTRLVYKGKHGRLKEDAEKEFKTVYAINKFACENYLQQFQNVYGIKYCILRICIPYGTLIPGASSYGTAEFMLSKAKNRENISLYGNGSQRRTLTYMGDLCDIIIRTAENEKCINDVYNIGGEDYSLKDMAELIAKKYNIQIDYVPWPDVALKIESGDTVFDDDKLMNIIGYSYNKKFVDWISE